MVLSSIACINFSLGMNLTEKQEATFFSLMVFSLNANLYRLIREPERAPGIAPALEYLKSFVGNIRASINDSSTLGFYEKLALPCHKLILYCVVGGNFWSSKECCNRFFDPTPLITSLGTCYQSMDGAAYAQLSGADDFI